MIERYLQRIIQKDMQHKMVFVGGPRQVGKTTLTKMLASREYKDAYAYINWDDRNDRRMIMNGHFPIEKGLLIFDEIHKYRQWKNYLKGVYDTHGTRYSILVTGSSRLDVYKKGGDSLLGRYHYFRLHPFSYSEVKGDSPSLEPGGKLVCSHQPSGEKNDVFDRLFRYGGFPEMFVKSDERELRRWHNERIDRLIKEDIRDIEAIRDLSRLQLCAEVLSEKVGSLFSINALTEDLQVTHKTVAYWIDVLERFYYHFRIYPFHARKVRTLSKIPKLYMWDWTEVEDESVRLENMIASHLLKMCHVLYDWYGYRAELSYVRDKDQREVDFLVSVKGTPWFLVEVKTHLKKKMPASVLYFKKKLSVPYAYVVSRDHDRYYENDVAIMPVSDFLSALY